MPTPDIDAVTRLIEDASRELVMPRFRRLRVGDVEQKAGDPDNLVTIVDREVEVCLTDGLRELWPDAAVIGEEAAEANPAILQELQSDRPVWIIDPIDGTRNFANGDDRFGVMVAFVERGCARAAWVFRPAIDRMFVAEQGSGVAVNGTLVSIAQTPTDGPPSGTLTSRYMPAAVSEHLARLSPGSVRPVLTSGCSAVEYTSVATGQLDFVVYYRLLPWDHAAPALVVTEAGGRVDLGDGRPYVPRAGNQLTVVARSAEVSAHVRALFPR